MRNELEEILLGAWLCERNVEDLKWFEPYEFENADVVRKLKEGKNLLTIGKELNRTSELASWTTYSGDVLYKQAFSEFLSKQIRNDIANTNSLQDIKTKLDKLQEVSFDVAEEVKDPAKALAMEIAERSTAKVIKWEKLPTLNNFTNGIKRKELTAIAARPAVGKSAFALQIAMGAWSQGEKVLYFPLEMSTTQSYGRVLVANGYATSKELQTGKFKNYDYYQLGIDYVDKIYQSKRFKVYEAEGQLERIEAVIKQEKPFLVVIDQLTQMKSKTHFDSIRAQFSYMTSSLKKIALKQNVAILLLCQINRSADNIEPTMANLKESGSIEEDSDNVILLHNLSADQLADPTVVDWQNERPMLLNLAKQRDGETGKFTMMFKPSKFTFYERAKEYSHDSSKEIY